MKKIVYFSGEWCAPCKVMLPLVKDVTKKLKVPLEVYDTEKDEDLAIRFNVVQLPTIIRVVDNQEIERVVGLQPKYAVEKFVSAY